MAESSRQSPPNPDRSEQEQAHSQSSLVHKLAAALGAILITFSIGTLLFDAFSGDDTPPEIVLHVEKVQPQSGGRFVVLFRAENKGHSAAADVLISAEIQDASNNRETSEAQLDYVPAHSERRGGLFFKSDPRNAQLELRATGFQEP